jgi:hypothetical protein
MPDDTYVGHCSNGQCRHVISFAQFANTIRSALHAATRPPQTLYERNARNVMIDGMGVGLVTGVATFLSVFLIRLGASDFQVGLLTAMPAITGALLALPVGDFIQRRTNIILWYARSRLWVLSSYALTGLVPFVVGRDATIDLVILIWALATLPQTMVNVTFTLVMRRLELMSRRWSTLGITNAVSVAVVGWALNQMAFPINYQVVYIASFAGGLLSYWFSTSIVLPQGSHVVTTSKGHWYGAFSGMGELLRSQPIFTRFVISQFVYRCGITMAIPLLPLYWVRVVQASDASIGLINTVNSGVLLLAYTLWTLSSRRFGQRWVLLVCSVGLALYPFLVAFSGEVWQLILLAGFAGTFVAGADLVLFDLLIATVAPDKRGPSVGLYHTTTFIATIIAPLLATAASDWIGIIPMLLVAALLRAAGAFLFWTLGIGRPEPGVT